MYNALRGVERAEKALRESRIIEPATLEVV